MQVNLTELQRAVDEYRALERDPTATVEREHYAAADLCREAERVIAAQARRRG